MAGEAKVTIKIPRELYKRLRRFVKQTGFRSVTELITFTMRALLSEEGRSVGERVKLVRKRLRKLGYKV